MKALSLCIALALPLLAAATPTTVLLNPGTASTVQVQQVQPASCNTPSVGDCGSCAVACQMDEVALCKPGKAAAAKADASCLREPSCRCESSHGGK